MRTIQSTEVHGTSLPFHKVEPKLSGGIVYSGSIKEVATLQYMNQSKKANPEFNTFLPKTLLSQCRNAKYRSDLFPPIDRDTGMEGFLMNSYPKGLISANNKKERRLSVKLISVNVTPICLLCRFLVHSVRRSATPRPVQRAKYEQLG